MPISALLNSSIYREKKLGILFKDINFLQTGLQEISYNPHAKELLTCFFINAIKKM
jgi:hypothetical protein